MKSCWLTRSLKRDSRSNNKPYGRIRASGLDNRLAACSKGGLLISISHCRKFSIVLRDQNYIIYNITQLQLKTFFEFSRKLEDLVPKILNELCDKNLANSLQRNGTVGCEKASEQLEAHQVSKRSFHIGLSYSNYDGNVSVLITVRHFLSIARPLSSNLPNYLISY